MSNVQSAYNTWENAYEASFQLHPDLAENPSAFSGGGQVWHVLGDPEGLAQKALDLSKGFTDSQNNAFRDLIVKKLGDAARDHLVQSSVKQLVQSFDGRLGIANNEMAAFGDVQPYGIDTRRS